MNRGTVVSLNISRGGVPKLPVQKAELGSLGFVGDGHDDAESHGGPERAVCIYAAELIEALQQEGHPIFPGSAGENITVRGVDWAEMVPGTQVTIGQAVVQVTGYTSPCKTIRGSFVNGRFSRISQKANPGWSRVYGRVLVGGPVNLGDGVVPVQS
jgi:MOSC domain-containing protein YiiM